MEKNTIEKLLKRYTGAATLLLGAQAANAQVTWFDIADTTLDKNGAFYDLDLDTNGIVDFRITQFVDSSSIKINGAQIETFGTAGNQVLGLDYANYNYPFRLNAGDTIEPGKTFKGVGQKSVDRYIGYLGLEINGTNYPNSQFVDKTNGVTDGFIGLRFRSTRNDTIRTYFGWVRVDVSADLKSVTIKDFAYEQEENTGIKAAEGSPLSVATPNILAGSLVQKGSLLEITLPEGGVQQAQLQVMDLSRKLLLEHEVSSAKSSLSLADLPKGVLVARLRYLGHSYSQKVVSY